MAEESKLAEKLEEKQEEVKFSEEEMTTVKQVGDTYQDIQYQFGQLSVGRLRVEQQLLAMDERRNQLVEAFTKNQEDETSFLEEISNKYGKGELDPQTGIFIPTKSE